MGYFNQMRYKWCKKKLSGKRCKNMSCNFYLHCRRKWLDPNYVFKPSDFGNCIVIDEVYKVLDHKSMDE